MATGFEDLKAAIEAACTLTRTAENLMCTYRAQRTPASLQAAQEAEKKAAEARNSAIALAKKFLGA